MSNKSGLNFAVKPLTFESPAQTDCDRQLRMRKRKISSDLNRERMDIAQDDSLTWANKSFATDVRRRKCELHAG